MSLESLSLKERAFAVAFIAGHHSITVHTALADVVVGCACTPGVQRDSKQWADHLMAVTIDPPSTSAAGAPTAASEGDRPAPEEEAGAGRVIPFPTK